MRREGNAAVGRQIRLLDRISSENQLCRKSASTFTGKYPG
jgi:hypothetical protein